MPETRGRFDPEYRSPGRSGSQGTGKPIVQVACDLGINEGTLGNWCAKDRLERQGSEGLSAGDLEELKWLRGELRMERDVLIG